MIGSIPNSLTQPHQGPDALRPVTDPAQAKPVAPSGANAAEQSAEQSKVQHAAQQFEAIFLRQLMSALERTGSLGGGAESGSASEIYGSMMVNALAEQSAQAGGIGLAELVARALAPPPTRGPSDAGTSASISTTYEVPR